MDDIRHYDMRMAGFACFSPDHRIEILEAVEEYRFPGRIPFFGYIDIYISVEQFFTYAAQPVFQTVISGKIGL